MSESTQNNTGIVLQQMKMSQQSLVIDKGNVLKQTVIDSKQ